MKTTSGARTWYSLAEFPQRASVSVTRAKPLPITRTKERFGVFKEGLHHGVWAVRVIRDHGASYPSGDHPRLDLRGYKRILQALLDAGRGRDPGPDRQTPRLRSVRVLPSVGRLQLAPTLTQTACSLEPSGSRHHQGGEDPHRCVGQRSRGRKSVHNPHQGSLPGTRVNDG